MTMSGARRPLSPVKPCTSLPQMPTASTASSTSPGRGSGCGRSTTRMVHGFSYRTAFMRPSIAAREREAKDAAFDIFSAERALPGRGGRVVAAAPELSAPGSAPP